MGNAPTGKAKKLIDTKDLTFLWKLIVKNLTVLVVVPMFAYLLGYIYTYRLTDVYGAKVQLLLKSNETYDYQDPIYKGLGAYGVYMDVQNQMRILQSSDLIGEIVDKINVSTSYYVVGRLKKQEVFETLPFKAKINVLNSSCYELPLQIKVINNDEFSANYVVNGQEKKILHKFDTLFVNEDFKIKLVKQYEFDDDNIESIVGSDYELINHSRDNLISRYRKVINVENVEYTSILEVSVLDELQYRGKRFLDTLTSVYIDFSKRMQQEVNGNTLENINKQLDTVSKFIQDKEMEMLRYKNDNSILHLSKEENEYFQKYVEATKIERELNHDVRILDALESYIVNLGDEHFLPPSSELLTKDLYLNTTLTKIYSLQLDLKSKSLSQVNDNPHILNVKAQISTLKKDILIYIDNLRSVYSGELEDIKSFIKSNTNKIQKIPVSEQGISNIKRELDVNNKMYLFLLEKKTNTLIARAGIIPQVRIVESASILGVIQPDKSKLIRLFVLGGLVFALLIAVVRKLFFEKIENVTELANVTDLTIMGGLPFIKEVESKLIVTQKPKAQITESFRTLRTNLSYMGEVKDTAKIVLISSFFPGEGKTFTSTNTASLISMSDKKVLIIDFDLHKPKIHKTFEIQNTKGVSSFLIGKDTLDDILIKDIKPNLDVITAGPIPPNPSELILKKQMNELFDQIKDQYDYIIVDTPPFGLLNDAIELVKFVDAFMVVMNTKFIRNKGVSTIEDLLGKYDDISVGLVLNGIKKTRFQYYYSKYTYKYNYNYGYNYGYGYGDSYSDYVDED
jgi:capsular exopolysaccharide synthesis family protein